jgi:hypothetical protein
MLSRLTVGLPANDRVKQQPNNRTVKPPEPRRASILYLAQVLLDQFQILLQGLFQLAFYQLAHGGTFKELRVAKIIAQLGAQLV